MIIRKIRMINFRGFTDKTIDFQGKPVVLLSAANGIGKTTTIDAIEWCLTGNIGRLKVSFDTRSTNDDDRRLNSAGILKNRDARNNATVKVMLTLFDRENEIVLCREQRRDILSPDASTVTIDKSTEKAEEFLRKYLGDQTDRESFYNFHFCDIQKSFNVQSTKRDKLKVLFRQFITNYDAHMLIAQNLEYFAEDVKRHIEDAENQKVSADTIRLKEEYLEKTRAGAKNIPYPKEPLYPSEITDLDSLDQIALSAQQKVLRSCGFLMAKNELDKLVKQDAMKLQQAALREILFYWETKGESIRRAMEIGLPKNTDAITLREQKHRELKDLSLSKETILQDSTVLISLGNQGFLQADFEAAQCEIGVNEKKMSALSDEIDLLTKNNKMLKLLSKLSTSGNKKLLIDYRDSAIAAQGFARCPVCGSEAFADLDATSILKEANDYICQNNAAVKSKSEELSLLQVQIDALYSKIIQRARLVVQEELLKLAAEISDLKSLKVEVQPYFNAVKNLPKTLQPIQEEELTVEKAVQLLSETEERLMDESQEKAASVRYQRFLTVLGYEFENNTVKELHAKVTPFASLSPVVSDVSYDLFVAKLNSIESALANQSLLDQKQELDGIYLQNSKLDARISELQKLKDTANRRVIDIWEVVNQLSKNEYEKVGPVLSKFYDKLARFNVEGIHVALKNDGISLVDRSGKNIVNVLSSGQISVFMLAYFFAGINVRNEQEKMKIYFIDDLTACMDDVNMLAFMDLLKYQMWSKSSMEQLFFITCDDRISKLLEYKLGGREIELCKLKEEDFV